MAQALMPASSVPVQHLYRVDPLPTSRPFRHIHATRRRRRASLNSYSSHIDGNNKHNYYLSSLFSKQDGDNLDDKHPIFTPESTFSYNKSASPRSCVHSFSNMASVESVHNEALPSSPPDLTESKSSKSSGSFHSSCLTDATGPENLSHFEEIALADSGRDSVEIQSHVIERKLVNNATKRRQSGPTYTRKTGDALRDSTNTARPHIITAKGQLGGAFDESQRKMAAGPGTLRRGFTSPSAISIGTMSMSSRDRSSSRSPSPSGFSSVSRSPLSPRSPRSPRSAGSRANSFTSNHRNFTHNSRPKSMQPRKTIEELEAEYHDSDEEVPEDAVIWNVPISPRPPFASQPPSPKRSSSQSHLTTDGIPKQSSDPMLKPESPRSPNRPGMRHSATMGAFPSNNGITVKGRTISWSLHLSEEAREVSAALEEHAQAARETGVRRASNPQRPNLDKMRAKTSVIELPPLQKGNIMIDPLPISKEKEAVLSRTRPSWLPPKSQKEERKHLREWERMMARAAEAEKRREQRKNAEEKGKKETDHSIAKIWDEHVLPNWDSVVRQPRTRELWWRGVHPKSRGLVWAKAIGNELSLSEASYTAALSRAKALQVSINLLQVDERQRNKDAAWLAAIERDVPTVLPELGIFNQGAPLHEALTDVLLAYSAYRSDVGYVYGTHALAGLLVLNLSPSDAFVALANLLNRPMALAYLVNDQSGIKRAHAMVLSTLKYKMPRLHDHLMDENTGLDPEEWLTPFLMTMGTFHLEPEACSRIWDISVFEGDKTFVRAAVGVLSLLESKLYGGRAEIISLLGWGANKWNFGADEVVQAVREAGKVSPEKK